VNPVEPVDSIGVSSMLRDARVVSVDVDRDRIRELDMDGCGIDRNLDDVTVGGMSARSAHGIDRK